MSLEDKGLDPMDFVMNEIPKIIREITRPDAGLPIAYFRTRLVKHKRGWAYCHPGSGRIFAEVVFREEEAKKLLPHDPERLSDDQMSYLMCLYAIRERLGHPYEKSIPLFLKQLKESVS